MRAIIYCRVSSAEQVENLSLATQEETARQYCVRQGWTVEQVFVEKGESAKTTDRPELQALLRHCRKHRGSVQYLVVYNLSRFARDVSDHFALTTLLRRCDITLRSVTENLDDSAYGKMLEGILATFAQFDNDVRSERTVAGMKAALRRGFWVFQPPLGYRSQDGRMEIDPEEGRLVRRSFDLLASGVRTQRQVLEALTSAGLCGRRNRGRLTLQTLTKILRNPFYMGRILVPRWGIDTEGLHPKLVDEKLYFRVQLVLARGKGRRRHTSSTIQTSPCDGSSDAASATRR